MLTTVLLLLASVEGRGELPPPIESSAREVTRVRAGLGFIVAAGVGFRGRVVGFGPGVSLELGATFVDRVSIVARASLGTIFIASSGTVGVGVDLALSERWSLGLGVALASLGAVLFTDMPFSWSIAAPVRAVFAPFPRAAQEVGRRGLVLFAEVTPGYVWVASLGYVPQSNVLAGPPFSIAGLVGVGFAWW
jgi:hypothetical protein